AALRDAWERFGLGQGLATLPDARARSLVQAMIFGRVLSPGASAPASRGASFRLPPRPGVGRSRAATAPRMLQAGSGLPTGSKLLRRARPPAHRPGLQTP